MLNTRPPAIAILTQSILIVPELFNGQLFWNLCEKGPLVYVVSYIRQSWSSTTGRLNKILSRFALGKRWTLCVLATFTHRVTLNRFRCIKLEMIGIKKTLIFWKKYPVRRHCSFIVSIYDDIDNSDWACCFGGLYWDNYRGLYWQKKHCLIGIGIPIINLRRSSDRLRFIMETLIPIRRRLFNE